MKIKIINETELAIKITKYIDKICKNVPHDIGLNIIKIIQENGNINVKLN